MKLLGKSSQCGEKCPQGSQVFTLLLHLILFSLSFLFFSFFISYERQSLLPNTEAPQELIIQKTRSPQRTRRTSERGGRRRAERDAAKMRACVKVGRGCLHLCVCMCVCVLSTLLMTVKSLSELQGILHIPQASLL